MKVELTLKNFRKFQRKCIKEKKKHPIMVVVANGTCAQTAGSKRVVRTFKKQLTEHRLNDIVLFTQTYCIGLCSSEPNALVRLGRNKAAIFYVNLKPKDVKRIVTETIIGKKILDDLLYEDPVTGRRPLYREDTIFFGRQKKVLLERMPLK